MPTSHVPRSVAIRRIYTNLYTNQSLRSAAITSPCLRQPVMAAVATSASLSTLQSTAAETSRPKRPRRFAPLDPGLTASGGESEVAEEAARLPLLRGIVFDVDGTLCLTQNYMFKEMRAALDIPKSVDILDHIRSLSSEPDNLASESHSSPQSRAVAKIQAIERNAMTSQRAQPGLEKLITYLSDRGVRKALCTRNFPAPVHHLLDKFLPGQKFEPIITRDTEGVTPKPSPEGIWRIAESWGLHLETKDHSNSIFSENKEAGGKAVDPLELARRHLGAGLIMVGDSVDDMAAGYRSGAATVLLINEENEALADHEYTDLGIRRLDELVEVLEKGFQGKN